MTSHGTAIPEGRYSVRQVSDMLDLSPRQIRALVADGALTPTVGARGKYLFSFEDLVVLRSAAELIRSGVAPHKVRAAVTSLLDQLPEGASLTAASLDASGSSVVASVDATTWDPVTKQLVLDLDVEATTDRIVSAPDAIHPEPHQRTAAEWYAYADEIEAADPGAAEEAYRHAIEIDSSLAEAHLNLGYNFPAPCTLHPAPCILHPASCKKEYHE